MYDTDYDEVAHPSPSFLFERQMRSIDRSFYWRSGGDQSRDEADVARAGTVRQRKRGKYIWISSSPATRRSVRLLVVAIGKALDECRYMDASNLLLLPLL